MVRKTKKNSKVTKTKTCKTRNTRQKGGKKLGEGGFGCVIHPGIPCDTSSSSDPAKVTRTISKIIPDGRNEQYQREMEIYKHIKQIDPPQRFLISYNEECQLPQKEVDRRRPRDIIRVKYLDNKKDEYSFANNPDVIKQLGLNTYDEEDIDDEFCHLDVDSIPRNLVQLYGGRRLNQLLHRSSKIDPSDPNMNFHKKLVMDNALSIIRDLIYGIYLMHNSKLVHRDIKYSNIVSIIGHLGGNKYPITRHIDFGLSQDVSKMKPSLDEVAWQGTADRIPIEIYMLYIMSSIRNNYPKMKFSDQNVRSTIIRRTMNKYRKKARKFYRSLDLNKSYLGQQNAYIGDHITNDNNSIAQKRPKNNRDLAGNTQKTNSKRDTLARNKDEYITIDDLHELYNKFDKEDKEGILGKKYIAKYTGYVYKTDIFALGLIIKDMAKKTNHSLQLKPLVMRMCAVDPDKRPIITDCIEYLDAFLDIKPLPKKSPI